MNKNLKFEDALKRLEEIVSKLESGDVELDESLKLFEEGMELANFCSKKLNEIKNKIEILVKKGEVLEQERNDEVFIRQPFEKESAEEEEDEELL